VVNAKRPAFDQLLIDKMILQK